jgi:hypothetical protein
MKQEKAKESVYLMGSLANENIPFVGNKIRELGFEAIDDWWSPGPLADSYLKHYAKIRGLNYKQTLETYAAKHIFNFDKGLIDKADIGVLVMSAGKSAHLELGYLIGTGKPGYVLFDKEPAKIDIMYQFAKNIFFDVDDLLIELKKQKKILSAKRISIPSSVKQVKELTYK